METIAFYLPCFCLSNRVWHGQIISCTVVIYPNYFKCLGTIFAMFLLQKTHYFLERTHQILTPWNVSAARCRLLQVWLTFDERVQNNCLWLNINVIQWKGTENISCDIWSAAHGCLKVKVKYYNKNVLLRLKTLFIQCMKGLRQKRKNSHTCIDSIS